MTMMSLRTLLEKSSDVELSAKMVGFAAQRQMELEAEGLTGAAIGRRARTGSLRAMVIATGPRSGAR